MTLKKFIKYFDDMNEIFIVEFPNAEEEGNILFQGFTFDDGARKKLKKLYQQGYELERQDVEAAVMLFPYKNEHGVADVKVQINVKKKHN